MLFKFIWIVISTYDLQKINPGLSSIFFLSFSGNVIPASKFSGNLNIERIPGNNLKYPGVTGALFWFY
jgi:hypothetical protein